MDYNLTFSKPQHSQSAYDVTSLNVPNEFELVIKNTGTVADTLHRVCVCRSHMFQGMMTRKKEFPDKQHTDLLLVTFSWCSNT